jgi:hypothetical protein
MIMISMHIYDDIDHMYMQKKKYAYICKTGAGVEFEIAIEFELIYIMFLYACSV